MKLEEIKNKANTFSKEIETWSLAIMGLITILLNVYQMSKLPFPETWFFVICMNIVIFFSMIGIIRYLFSGWWNK